jgi:hypothetical protein
MAQQSESIAQRNYEKIRGDEIRLLPNFPESKPFWEDSFHLLECFTCKFLEEVNKNCDKPIKQMDWMTKWIKKGNKTHIIAFCYMCTSRDPWMIHSQMGYMMLQINPTNKQEPLLQQKKHKTLEGWPELPKKVPYYKDNWCLGDLYNRFMDWSQQSDEYDKKVKTYKKEKTRYNTFCEQKLKEIPEI